MNLLVTGICGFVGSTLARALLEARPGLKIVGLDNFIRPGSQSNITDLKRRGVALHHGDVRAASDFETLPAADWVIDCAANPSVLAGVDGRTSSRQLVEHNLAGTVNMLEFCKQHRAGFILLSTSRVYSIPPLAALPVVARDGAFAVDTSCALPAGVSAVGVSETFSTAAPVSLYGATKLASEALALEYAATFGFTTYINRCGVMAGAGQFGRPDQGIFAYWIHSWACRRPLRYIGFDGQGHQVRDCLHPADLAPLVLAQMDATTPPGERVLNISGGAASARSLRQISAWCESQFGPHPVTSDPAPRPFDIPWMVLDSSAAARVWNWRPARSVESIMAEIADHARAQPDWLDLSAPL
ncbi:MAG: NAD-dependent epimerase/dehydratase family protein [Opitutaceae bacterium]|nr:NAD-dependent epimerase/dehydratase family protein [Opitutaceae bacterium]